MPTITAAPRILGVDDFAFRKGHRYGTVLVDLEQHKPVALLPDRTAETLAEWLKEHPGSEILSRDRSKTYRRGMTDGAPDAIQVADRFHLLKNLEEVLEKAFKGKSKALKEVDKARLQAEGIVLQALLDTQCDPQCQKAQNRARRLEKYEQIHALRQQGYRIKDIAHHLGIGKRTVYTYLAAPTFPEPAARQRSSGLDAYKPYLLEQWQQGHQHSKELFGEIQAQGYKGSYGTLARYTHQLRQSQPRPDPESLKRLPGLGPAPKGQSSGHQPLSAQRAAWLILQREETLTSQEATLLERLGQQPELSEAIALAQEFIAIVRQRLPENLTRWLEQAKSSVINAFQSFAKGIEEDYDAVQAGIILDVSNGQVEGQINRLKMLKRQMYGRAGLDLLARRFIMAA